MKKQMKETALLLDELAVSINSLKNQSFNIENQQVLKTYLLFIERFYENFRGLALLLKSDNSTLTPILIILRTVCSDCLTALYIDELYKSDQIDKIKTFLNDGIRKLPKENTEEIISIMKKQFPDSYDQDGKLIEVNSVAFMASGIKAKLSDRDITSFTNSVYEQYNYLSKIEHVSFLTDDFKSINDSFLGLKRVLYNSLIVIFTLSIVDLIKDKEPFENINIKLQEYLDIISKELE